MPHLNAVHDVIGLCTTGMHIAAGKAKPLTQTEIRRSR